MHEFWISNAELFAEARAEYGVRHPALYDLASHHRDFLQPALVAAVEACEAAARSGRPVPESAVLDLLRPAGAAGVWRLPVFTPTFCELLLEELEGVLLLGLLLLHRGALVRHLVLLPQPSH